MTTPTRAKIRNISGDDLVVPWLDGRLVAAGDVVSVPTEDVAGYLCQAGVWEAGDHEAQATYDAEVANAAAQLDADLAQLVETLPEPWVPELVPLGVEATVATQPSEEPGEQAATQPEPAPREPAPEPTPATAVEPAAEEPAPAPSPAPAEDDDEPREMTPAEVERDLPPRLRQLLDRTSAPAASTFTGSLPAQPRL